MPFRIPIVRLQFNLRWLFYVTLAAGVCAYLATNNGPAEAIGFGIAFALLGLAIVLPQFRFRRPIRCLLATIILLVIWVVGVDRSVFRLTCRHCSLQWYTIEYRFLAQPILVWKTDDYHPSFGQIAEDLGAPCAHDFELWHRNRFWGVVFYCDACFSGTDGLSETDWYTQDLRQRARQLANAHPELGPKIRAALVEHNYPFIRSVIAQIMANETATQVQPQ